MNDAVGSILSILLVIALGYVLAKRGWFPEGFAALLAKLVVSVSVPALMVSSLTSQLERETLFAAGLGILVPFGLIALAYLLSWGLEKLFVIPQGRRGVFRAIFTFTNSVFLGMPVNVAIFGMKAVPFVIFFYLANTTLFWTVGVYGIKRDGPGVHPPLLSLESLKNILSITLVAVLAAFALKLLGWTPPRFFLEACRHLGNLTTPLSMLYVGIVVASVNLRKIKPDRVMIALILMRFLVFPAAMVLAVRAFPLPQLMKQVFVLEFAMPVMTQTAIVAKAHSSDGEFASVLITITTALSVLIIPLYMAFFALIPDIVR